MQITRRFEFPMGHRLMNHEGGCKYSHGHNFSLEVTVESPVQDSVGRVIDFSVLKKLVGTWIEDNWDHSFVLNGLDKEFGESTKRWAKLYWLPEGVNPTSENLSAHIFKVIEGLLPKPLSVRKVVLHETSNCWSTYPDRDTQFS